MTGAVVESNPGVVAKDVPLNSHLNFDLIIPISNVAREEWFNVWINNNQFVYVLLDQESDKARLEQQFPAFMHKYMGADMARFGAKFDLKLKPLSDIVILNPLRLSTMYTTWR